MQPNFGFLTLNFYKLISIIESKNLRVKILTE